MDTLVCVFIYSHLVTDLRWNWEYMSKFDIALILLSDNNCQFSPHVLERLRIDVFEVILF